jgi:hypothetical protein
MSQPNPPVGGTFRPDGLHLVVIEGDVTYQRTISWKDLYTMARRGDRQTAKGMVKTFTKWCKEAVKSNEKVIKDGEKRLKEMQKITYRPVLKVAPYRS